jgi:hypothetical protein
MSEPFLQRVEAHFFLRRDSACEDHRREARDNAGEKRWPRWIVRSQIALHSEGLDIGQTSVAQQQPKLSANDRIRFGLSERLMAQSRAASKNGTEGSLRTDPTSKSIISIKPSAVRPPT